MSGLLTRPHFRNLFGALAEHGRLGETERVIDGFLELMSAHRGEVEVVVTSAAVSLRACSALRGCASDWSTLLCSRWTSRLPLA